MEKTVRHAPGDAAAHPHRCATVLAGTLLVADDDRALLHGLELAFRRRGATVLTASTGVEALRLYVAQGERIDAVVLDLSMPDLDGEAVYSRLRRLDSTLPVLVHTAEHRPGFETLLEADPCAALERKPCRFADLLEALTLLRAT